MSVSNVASAVVLGTYKIALVNVFKPVLVVVLSFNVMIVVRGVIMAFKFEQYSNMPSPINLSKF